MVKFSHTIFAMPFALVGFFVATEFYNYSFEWINLLYIVLCMIFARNSAMAFNRYLDRDIDKKNPRTANREIPAEKISPKKALIFTIANSVLFILCTTLINTTALLLSPVAIAVVLFYSYTKRFTFFAHLFLGLGLAIAPAGAFIAVSETLTLPIIILSAIVFLWTAGFDVIYALQDEEFDRENKLFSIPAKFGRKKALWISIFLHIGCMCLCIIWGFQLDGNYMLWIGISTFLALLAYQHIIVSPKDISRVNQAFATTNGIASVSFAAFVIISLFM